MPWVSRDWKAKWLHLVWELVEFLSVVLSATEATRYTGLAVLVSKPSKADTCCVCPNVAEGLKKGGGGNITAKGADWASVQKAD